MEDSRKVKKRKNKFLYNITMLVILIIFLVIFLSGKYLGELIYIDKLPRQPINNIKGIDPNKENSGKTDDTTTGKSPIEYTFTEDKTYGNYIYMINQFPMKDEVGRKLEGTYKTFDFKLKFSKKSLGVNYEITLDKMEDSDLENSWVKVYLECEGEGIKNAFRTNGRVKTFNEYPLYNGKLNEIVLLKGKVTQEEVNRGYKNYRLRMWISEDVKVVNEEYKSKTIVARVNVHASGNI